MFTPMQPVYVHLDGERTKKYAGMVVCDVGEMQGNIPQKIYAVRFMRDGRLYDKCVFIGCLSPRNKGAYDGRLSRKAPRDWLSGYLYNQSFKKRYMFGIRYKQMSAKPAARRLSKRWST